MKKYFICCIATSLLFSSLLTACSQSESDVDRIVGYWQKANKNNEIVKITRNTYAENLEEPADTKITYENGMFLISIDGFPFGAIKIKSIDKERLNFFSIVNDAPLEYKRITKAQYEQELAELRKK